MDIAMLYLNAGLGGLGPFTWLSNAQVQAIVGINALQPIYLTKVLLPQMIKRETRSAILVTSSGMGSQPVSGIVAYTASKAFSTWFASALHFEVKDKIDVMAWECGEVATNLRPVPANNANVLTVDAATKGALRDLGKEHVTCGDFRHEWC
mmetsp:Transcript_6368/g.8259  ORF Transcript_6368/g.8259 Transcript_6368/m.8259 type:complete len:151 (-) Transcript_6368:148-600(-)